MTPGKLNGPWSALLRGAYKTQSEVKLFQCNRCYKRFKSQGNLTNHAKTHPSVSRPSNQGKVVFINPIPKVKPVEQPEEDANVQPVEEEKIVQDAAVVIPKARKKPMTRARRDAKTMWRLIQGYEACDSKGKKTFLKDNNLPYDTMKRWRKPKRKLIIKRDAQKRSLNGKGKSSIALSKTRKAVYPEKEDELYELYKVRRAKGLPVDGEYFSSKMIILVKRDHPDANFKASDCWKTKFLHRYGISLQSKTNKKSKSIQERLPKVRNFHWWTQYQMALEEP